MPDISPPHPPIVSESEWLTQRKVLLQHEKELTKLEDKVNAERRRLPMVKIEKQYRFEGPEPGESRSLTDLFAGRTQLIVYHFMFDPEWEKGCPGCTGMVNELGDLSLLNERDTTYVLVSRAPLAKLKAHRESQGWTIPWYSSFGSDFNYDFNATHDESKAPVAYNFQNKEELVARNYGNLKGEDAALSVFFRLEDDVYHTYSAFARGLESLTDSYSLLDVTPYGRQEEFEESPPGWPQKPTYG